MSVYGSDALLRALRRLCALGAKEKTPHLRGFHWGRHSTIERFMDVPFFCTTQVRLVGMIHSQLVMSLEKRDTAVTIRPNSVSSEPPRECAEGGN